MNKRWRADVLFYTDTTTNTKELGDEGDLVCGLDFNTELACTQSTLIAVDHSQ